MHNSKLENEKDIFYVYALYMTKSISPEMISSFVMNYQHVIPYSHTYQRLFKLHSTRQDEDIEMEKKIKINLTCGITCMQLKVPVKGRWCDHYHCFDLENYLNTNLQCPKWMCPENNKDKPVKLYRDEFTMHLL
jgi:hypothetical protein